MGKINVLSFEIANLIAAGEVVERPSSVLKELIENSIDAGATEIVAEIKRGGVALIRVTDNGCGIEKDDLPVSLKRHATSKIKDREDLNSIVTLGFRGEALAAISSVSEVTIITKTKESEIGYMLSSEGGNIIDISEVGASEGTTVVVENLFFNVPARRKFLKKDSTEAMNVAALVEKVALSRPDISFQLLIDGQEKFKTPGDSKLINALRAVFGRDFASKLIEVNGSADGIKVTGYVGRSDNVRKNRNLENIFINGRYVKSLTAQAALEKAYTSYIATEHFPCCALFIEMNPGIVDVNVHPAKLEVKFSDERRVFEAVYYSVRRALEESEYRPEMQLGTNKGMYNPADAFVPIGADTKGEQISISAQRSAESGYRDRNSEAVMPRDNISSERKIGGSFSASERYTGGASFGIDRPVTVRSETKNLFSDSSPKRDATVLTPRESVDLLERYRTSRVDTSEDKPIEEKLTDDKPQLPEYKYVGEAFDCYVMIEYDGALLIIDKHAAHERIIFEDLKRGRSEDKRLASQALMLPMTVILTPDELSSVAEYTAEFEAVGFEFRINDRSVDITGIPDAILPSDAEGLFVEMLGDIISGSGTPENLEQLRREKILHTVACKAAIKGGRVYDRAVIEWLIKKVLELPDITVCPHGRPIAYKLKKSELDRQFDRIK
ncbi:MAG: DNA mismatch repair endonuclease MutL [Ruminococcaceae bacterium]|nr:DNA mismatch repair endonuclease MutL [Oscillospiraceae bacterium]